MEHEEVQASEEFDINDPAFTSIVPTIDTEAVPKMTRPAPPKDGYYFVKAKLSNREGKHSVELRPIKNKAGIVVDGKVMAAVTCRLIDNDPESIEYGKLGGFLKDWFPSTQSFEGQKGTQLTGLCLLAGSKVPEGADLGTIKEHVERVFAEAGEEGITLFVRTRWIQRVPKVEEIQDGFYAYVFDQDGKKVYEKDLKGEKAIKAEALRRGVAPEEAHIWLDPVSEEEVYCSAEVAELVDPARIKK